MTLLELNDFAKQFEEEFGVTAQLPITPLVIEETPEEEEQTTFDVVVTSAGQTKIQVIKAVRALTNHGLKEAKALVDDAPSVVLANVDWDQAQKAKRDIEAVGGEVELR
jgi:large subunit ribosomal protein L7/L12